MTSVVFLPVTEAHRELLRQWLSTPHAREWWGDPEEELALIYDGKGEHEPFLASVEGEPVAYVQAWWPSHHDDLPWQHGLDEGTRGIDITIGPEVMLSRGLGPLILRHFAAKLFSEGARRLVIDPDIRNTRAISAYMKAGFTPYETWEQDGQTDLLMELVPDDFDYGSGYGQTGED